jgi:diacylglycerol kinase family enzyme
LVGSGVPLGLISLGTFNNLARSLGIPRPIEAALDVIIAGQVHPVDAGRVNGRVFFECAGAGWDATLFPLGEHLKRGKVGPALRALRGLLDYSTRATTLLLDGQRRISSRTPTVLIANGPYVGSSFAVAPTSRLDDGRLTVLLFEGFSRADLLAYFAAVAEGRPRQDWRVVSHRAMQVRVISPAGLPAHADGEPIGPLATPFEAVPQALLAITPTNHDGRRRAQTARWTAPVVSAAAAAALDAGGEIAVAPSAVQPAARTMRWRVMPEEPPEAPGGGAG